MLSRDWNRWIVASINAYLKQVSDSLSIPAYLEGVDSRSESLVRGRERAEIRILGPFPKHIGVAYAQLHLNVSVLLSSSALAPYGMAKMVGVFQEAMDLPIGVWNYGSEIGDYDENDASSQIYIGCLLPIAGQSGKVINFGLVDPVLQLQQTEVETSYMMEI